MRRSSRPRPPADCDRPGDRRGNRASARAGRAAVHPRRRWDTACRSAPPRLAEAAQVPVGHTLMGSGALPPGPSPARAAWSDSGAVPSANRLASTADLILAVGTRFPETDSSSWEPGATFAIPPTRLIHIDIDPNEPGRNYPTESSRGRGCRGCPVGDRRSSPPADPQAAPRFDWAELAGGTPSLSRPWRGQCPLGTLPLEAGTDPCRPSPRGSRRHPCHRRGLEQERDGPAVPDR